jgi:hypothetical protein
VTHPDEGHTLFGRSEDGGVEDEAKPAVAEPPAPVHVTEYTQVPTTGGCTTTEPLIPTEFVPRFPEVTQAVAFVLVQLIVVVAPTGIVVGSAVTLTVGSGTASAGEGMRANMIATAMNNPATHAKAVDRISLLRCAACMILLF